MGITKTDTSQYGHLRGGARQDAHSETLRFRTPEPIPYTESNANNGLSLNITLICEGECEWQVCDPSVFGMTCEPGAKLNEQLENELSLALELALAKLDAVPHDELPRRSDEIGASLAEDLFPLWREKRGIQATRFCLTSAVPPQAKVEAPPALTLAPSPDTLWVCPSCGRENRDNYCPHCGAKRPE